MMSTAKEKAKKQIKRRFITSIRATKRKMEFSFSQKQAVAKLIQKKDWDERFKLVSNFSPKHWLRNSI